MDVTAIVIRSAKLIGFVICLALLSACEMSSDKATVPYNSLKNGDCSGTAVENRYVIKWKDGEVTGATFQSEEEMREILVHFKDDIEIVEDDQILKSQEFTVSESAMATADWGQVSVEAANAWNQNVKGDGVVVAVIDSGVDRNHAQIAPRIAVNAGEVANNGVDDDSNGVIDDVSGYWFWMESKNGQVIIHDTPDVIDTTGHGTHVAGIVAADHTTGGIKGLAPKAKILPIGFMTQRFDEEKQKWVGTGGGLLSDAARAIQYATIRGVKIINASWGGGQCSKTLKSVISDLESQGILFVDAAGNMGSNIDFNPEYPAAFNLPGQIVVGSYGPAGGQSQFSNYSTNLVHLLAPGDDIVSTYPGNGIMKMSGTSMASPFVAGAAALLMSDRPQATVAQIKQAILSSVVTGNFEVMTRGKLNVKNALAAIRTAVP